MPPLINKENIITAHSMYMRRIEALHSEISKIGDTGLQLGKSYKAEALAALDEIENELEGIDECLAILKHLLRS